MLSHISSMTFRRASVLTMLTMLAVLAAPLVLPAAAIDGRTAVGMCIDSTASGARCAWSVNDKGEIDICNKSGCVFCPSATGQCTVAKHRPRPTRTLPPGTKIDTGMGAFDVARRALPESALIRSASCPREQIMCPNHGCVPAGMCDFPK